MMEGLNDMSEQAPISEDTTCGVDGRFPTVVGGTSPLVYTSPYGIESIFDRELAIKPTEDLVVEIAKELNRSLPQDGAYPTPLSEGRIYEICKTLKFLSRSREDFYDHAPRYLDPLAAHIFGLCEQVEQATNREQERLQEKVDSGEDVRVIQDIDDLSQATVGDIVSYAHSLFELTAEDLAACTEAKDFWPLTFKRHNCISSLDRFFKEEYKPTAPNTVSLRELFSEALREGFEEIASTRGDCFESPVDKCHFRHEPSKLVDSLLTRLESNPLLRQVYANAFAASSMHERFERLNKAVLTALAYSERDLSEIDDSELLDLVGKLFTIGHSDFYRCQPRAFPDQTYARMAEVFEQGKRLNIDSWKLLEIISDPQEYLDLPERTEFREGIRYVDFCALLASDLKEVDSYDQLKVNLASYKQTMSLSPQMGVQAKIASDPETSEHFFQNLATFSEQSRAFESGRRNLVTSCMAELLAAWDVKDAPVSWLFSRVERPLLINACKLKFGFFQAGFSNNGMPGVSSDLDYMDIIFSNPDFEELALAMEQHTATATDAFVAIRNSAAKGQTAAWKNWITELGLRMKAKALWEERES